MIEVLIKETGERLDVTGGIKYTFQTSEIGDISEINSSWSWSIKFPYTANNISIFDGLGLVGNTSDFPYSSIEVAVIYNSISIIENGKLSITSFKDREYQGNVSSGISEFFDEIEKQALEDVPSIINSDLSHDKNLTNIVNSWNKTEPYLYAMADWNGKLNVDPSFVDFDSNYLVPSANVKWLMDRIFQDFGWTYSGLPEINLDWITYGNYLQEEGQVGLSVAKLLEFNNITKASYIPNMGPGVAFPDKTYPLSIDLLAGEIDPTYLQNNGTNIEILDPGDYIIKMPFYDFSEFGNSVNIRTVFKINGVQRVPASSSIGYGVFRNLNNGDKLSFEVVFSITTGTAYTNKTIRFIGGLSIINQNATKVNFQGASLEYKLIEFIKEVMMRNASVAIANVKTKHISFYDIQDRLNFPVVDWTDKLIKVTGERYVYQDYARENFLRHTYEEKDQSFHDGQFDINNENLEDSKTIYQSKTFSSNKNPSDLFPISTNNNFIGFKAYEIEQKNNGEVYKPLNKRFFFLRATTTIGTQLKINGTSYTLTPWAEARDFDLIVKDKYSKITDILNRVKVVNVELNLNLFDIKELSFEKRYYFQQEAAYFLLNKLTWDSEQSISKAEFIKVQ